tara:strand:- start:483 stop:953 length:471 start_codon:yes stop_codon:yes gene_type:complete
MKKPTLEEVREYFKDAKVVKCVGDNNEFDVTKFNSLIDAGTEYHFGKENFNDEDNDEFVTLWNEWYGYAKILEYKNQYKKMRKVIRLDQPKEEKQLKPIELTHYQDESGWHPTVNSLDIYNKIFYLGRCKLDGDKFACFIYGEIRILKGHLNDGVY